MQTPGVDVKKNVIVAITSDKGLCGGINSTSVKVSKALLKMTSGNVVHDYLSSFISGS
jgi:F-type H+-transporting ATPase subunit gamma